MKLQTQIKSGVSSVKEILEKQFPEIKFQIEHGMKTPGGTTVILYKKMKNGRTVAYMVSFTLESLSEINPEIIKDMLEDAVDKLREYVREVDSRIDNPSSRRFGEWI